MNFMGGSRFFSGRGCDGEGYLSLPGGGGVQGILMVKFYCINIYEFKKFDFSREGDGGPDQSDLLLNPRMNV